MFSDSQPDYESSVKNRWRTNVWKQAARRLDSAGVAPSNAVCLYLPGPKDLDRKAAVSRRGFRPYNLIGCDKSLRVAKTNRDAGSGRFCINADFLDVLNAWPEKPPANFVNADLCCGFDKACAELIDWIVHVGCRQRQPLVMCVNIQRGRDSFTNQYRDFVSEHLKLRPLTAQAGSMKNGFLSNSRFFINHVNDWHQPMVRNVTKMAQLHRGLHFAVFLERVLNLGPEFIFNLSLGSYRAARVWMDSVIFDVPYLGSKEIRLNDGRPIGRSGKKKTPVSRKISATLAHRTMLLKRSSMVH